MSALRKNVASQHIGFVLTNSTTGAPVTAGGAGNVVIDGGAQAACAGTFTHKGSGQWDYAPTQAETNGNSICFAFTGTSALQVGMQLFTIGYDPTQAVVPANTTQLAGQTVNAAGAVTFPATVASPTLVWQDATAGDFTVASSIGKSLFTGNNAPGAASGLALVGSNMGSVSSVTGNVAGNVVGSVGSISGVTFPTNFSAISIDGSGNVATTSNIKKNTVVNNFPFTMTDSTTHAPKPSLTVTAQRSIDGAAFASCANAVVEVSNGDYNINLAAADTNGNRIMYRFTATGADDLNIAVVTQP